LGIASSSLLQYYPDFPRTVYGGEAPVVFIDDLGR
jgi:hypothetical protein